MRYLKVVLIGLALAVALSACSAVQPEREKLNRARESSLDYRAASFEKANRVAPLSGAKNVNFPMRKALIEWNNRGDLVNHPWYIYLLADTGAPVGYYVAKTQPISTCNFVSSTEEVNSSSEGRVLLTAPSIDGMFYGGSGASGGCAYFFQDYATGAIVIISPTFKWQVADAPLGLDVKPIKVKQTK